MVLGWQEIIYEGSPQWGETRIVRLGGPKLEGNYLFGCLGGLLGCLAGLLAGLLARWQAWKLAIWLPYSKYHGSGLPRIWLFGVTAATGKRGLYSWGPLARRRLPTWLRY